jgi:lipopolysaccharide transport system permease protein
MKSFPLEGADASASDRPVLIIRPVSFSILSLLSNLAELKNYWDLIYTLSVHRIKVRYKQAALGISWAVFQPLAMMGLYTILFSYIMKAPNEDIPYTLLVFGGLLPWLCFQSGLSTAANGLVSHGNLISKIYFPREILPITYVIAALFDFSVASIVLSGMMMYFKVPLRMTALFAIPIMLVLVLFVTSLSLILSVIQVRFRDVGAAIPLLLQLWMFATPVVYPLSAIKSLSPALRRLYMLNPMVGLVDNFRQTVLRGSAPDLNSFAISMVVSLVLFPVGYIYFKHADANTVDRI